MMKSDHQTELLRFHLVCLQCDGNPGFRFILNQFSVNHRLELSPPQIAYEEKQGHRSKLDSENCSLHGVHFP